MQTPGEQEPLPSKDDLDFYYGMNRRASRRQDERLQTIGAAAFLIVALLTFLLFIACLFVPWLWIVFLIASIIFWPAALVLFLLGGASAASLAAVLNRFFASKEEE